MKDPRSSAESRGSLRLRILASVGAVVLLSLLGSTISLYRITDVSRSLDAINRVAVPLGRLFVQIQSDAEIYRREMDRRLGQSHWDEPGFRPKAMPAWIEEVIESQMKRARDLLARDGGAAEHRDRWETWAVSVERAFEQVREESARLQTALEARDSAQAGQIWPRLSAVQDEWLRQLQWGVSEHERGVRMGFARAESKVAALRTGLEIIVCAVVILSLLLLWLGERALRPIGELTRLAREITRRGLRREDKVVLPSLAAARGDEVSQLAREFHAMATALLEREKTVETQKDRLQDQNRLLRDMGALNQNVLRSIESALIVTDLDGRVTQFNPVAATWLGAEDPRGMSVFDLPRLRQFLPDRLDVERKLEAREVDGRVYGGRLMSLRDDRGETAGAIIDLEDLTDELGLQERLRTAENLAAVGRMSAQVAHEVRNPLHSIGLEAEIAADIARAAGNPALKQSLQSILSSVDRLEKITENYLKLSRLSSGEKRAVDLGDVLESVLATYAQACESQGVRVDWSREASGALRIWGDPDLLEQALGNLLRNSLQALETVTEGRIHFRLGSAETGRVWLRIEDNGPGIAEDVRGRLFTPFVKTRAQGTGLGLSFVKRVIEEHGGSVEYVEASGRGACFEVRLPPAAATSVTLPHEHSNEVNA